jgi:hypothetical protein
MTILKEADQTVASIFEFVFIVYLIGWVFFGFFGGLQTIWYIGNHRLLKKRRYTEWFKGYAWMYYFIVAISIFFFFGFIIMALAHAGWWGITSPVLIKLSLNFGEFYLLIALLGIWYPYAMVESFFKNKPRVLR